MKALTLPIQENFARTCRLLSQPGKPRAGAFLHMKTHAQQNYAAERLDPRWHRKSGIYQINIGDGFYIGSAISLTKRRNQHFSDLRASRHANIHLQRAFNKHGSIYFEIVEIVEDVARLIEREQFYIDTMKPRYNIAVTAGSQLGFRHSAESRALISKVQKGRVLSPETCRKMSEARQGIKLSEEHRKNISASKKGRKNPFYKAGSRHPQYGIPKSEQTRERISETSRTRGSHRGSNNAASKTGVLYDVNTGSNYVFLSLKPLCEKLGVPYAGIHSALLGGRFYRSRFYTSYATIPVGHPATTVFSSLEIAPTRPALKFDELLKIIEQQ
jgi:group I intron endonuclease